MLDDAGESAGVLAVQADVRGSRIDAVPQAVLETWLAASVGDARNLSWIDEKGAQSASDLAEQAGTKPSGSEGWILWLVAGALAFAVIETLLARWSARSMERLPPSEAIA